MDVQQDAAVTAAHHQQGDDVQRGEVEHVVDGFLPAAAEAAVGRTLSEVGRLHADRSEDEQLGGAESRVSNKEINATNHKANVIMTHRELKETGFSRRFKPGLMTNCFC